MLNDLTAEMLSEALGPDELALMLVEAARIDADCHDPRSGFVELLKSIRETRQGFDYRLAADTCNGLTAAVWMTGRQRERLAQFGDVLFFDGTHKSNTHDFILFLPTVLDEEKHAHRVAAAVCESENAEAATWIVERMQEMYPLWDANVYRTTFTDSGLGTEWVRRALPGMFSIHVR